MVKVNLGGCDSFVKDADYKVYVGKALEALEVLETGSGAGNDFIGWRHLPSETPESLIKECEEVRDCWKGKGVDLVVVIGIGGSYLGARCAIEALSHNFAKQLSKNRSLSGVEGPEVVFAGNNLSEEYLAEMMDLVSERNVATVVISKSGTTTEPAVAFRIVKEYIEKTYKDASERIVAITDAKKGALKTLATQEGYKTFVVPDNVGGRYSVLTPVGLLPIVLAGFDVREMLKGAQEMEKACAVKSEDNPAVKYAAMRNLLYSELGKKIEILVAYNPKLQYLGEWWKQLFGESEGKELKGIFPASVNFTTDLHSMGQFIQEGERIMFETVVSAASVSSIATPWPSSEPSSLTSTVVCLSWRFLSRGCPPITSAVSSSSLSMPAESALMCWESILSTSLVSRLTRRICSPCWRNPATRSRQRRSRKDCRVCVVRTNSVRLTEGNPKGSPSARTESAPSVLIPTIS